MPRVNAVSDDASVPEPLRALNVSLAASKAVEAMKGCRRLV
jgi:hypothetical protein